jgi:hypothetical protein
MDPKRLETLPGPSRKAHQDHYSPSHQDAALFLSHCLSLCRQPFLVCIAAIMQPYLPWYTACIVIIGFGVTQIQYAATEPVQQNAELSPSFGRDIVAAANSPTSLHSQKACPKIMQCLIHLPERPERHSQQHLESELLHPSSFERATPPAAGRTSISGTGCVSKHPYRRSFLCHYSLFPYLASLHPCIIKDHMI